MVERLDGGAGDVQRLEGALKVFSRRIRGKKVSGSKRGGSVEEQMEYKEVGKMKKEADCVDGGSEVLYDGFGGCAAMKSGGRLLDELTVDGEALKKSEFDDENGVVGLLRRKCVEYSEVRDGLEAWRVWTTPGNSLVASRRERKSSSCPQYNRIVEICGLLECNVSDSCGSFEEFYGSPNCRQIYHWKISVKTRMQLERLRKQSSGSRFYLIDNLHEFDAIDFPDWNPRDPRLVDYGIYVAENTNKLMLLQVFEPEFSIEDLKWFLDKQNIAERHRIAYEKYQSSSIKHPPDQIDVLQTLIWCAAYTIKLSDHNKPEHHLTIDSQIDVDWLRRNHNIMFKDETEKKVKETYHTLSSERHASIDSLLRKTLELIFLLKAAKNYISVDHYSKLHKHKALLDLNTSCSVSFWSQLLGEYRSILTEPDNNELNLDKHYINLSVTNQSTENEIIANYEILVKIDPDNIGIYFTSLKYIAENSENSTTLLKYCKNNEVVDLREQRLALQTFGLTEETLSTTSDATIWDIFIHLYYKSDIDHSLLRSSLNALSVARKSSVLKFMTNNKPYQKTCISYENLDLEQQADVETIILSFTMKMKEKKLAANKNHYEKSLFTLAVCKKSIKLFYCLYSWSPLFKDCFDISKITLEYANNFLCLPRDCGDITIINQIRKLWKIEQLKNPVEMIEILQVLKYFAETRNSTFLKHYFESGVVDPKQMTPEKWPMGLNNIGNTCYLNSLLQFYFSIVPIRSFITHFNPLHDESDGSQRRIGGLVMNDKEIERSIQFVYQLKDLFLTMMTSYSRRTTPRKQLAYLAFLPNTSEIEFESAESGSTQNADEDQEDGIIADVDSDKSSPLSSNESTQVDHVLQPKVNSAEIETVMEMGSQQDVTECIGNVLFQLEAASNPILLDDDEEQIDLVKKLFYGKTDQSMIPLNPNIRGHTKTERFVSLLVNVADKPVDIYDALNVYFKDEYLNMDEYGDVKKTLTISKFPAILQIQIQRVYYDSKKLMPYKCLTTLPFYQTIYLDRYASHVSPELQQSIELSHALNTKLKQLKAAKLKLMEESSLENAKASLFSKEMKSVDLQIEKVKSEMEHLFEPHKMYEYNLFAVFIHKGQATFGHYWIYIKDFKNDGIWRKYNDQYVTEVLDEEIFNFSHNNISTPYFLVYVRREMLESIQPLKRSNTATS